MPRKTKFQKEEIINSAYEIVMEQGFDQLNARKIAKRLGCSVQPIFHNFSSMEELMSEVHDKIYQTYVSYMSVDLREEKAYKKMGMSYIQFAKDYPQFFKILFMHQTNQKVESFVQKDALHDHIIQAGQQLTHLSYEDQKNFHIKVWIFTHGIACLIASDTVQLNQQEIATLLETTVIEMMNGLKKKTEEQTNGTCN